MTRPDLFICAERAAPELEPVEGDPQLYRKELIYIDHFKKQNPDGSIEFDLPVTEAMLDHWVAAHKKLVAAGIDVPLPIEHTNDPEKNRGKVERIEKEFNPDRGANALYAYVRFSDPETAKIARTTNVSLYSPSKFVDGKGTTHIRPIRHVALTDYPLIPKLGPWQAVKGSVQIALSESGLLDLNEDVEASMTFAELADQLGISYEEGASDDEIAQAIIDEWDNDTEPSLEDEEIVEDEELLEDPVGDPVEDEEVLDEEMVDEEEPTEEDLPASHSPSVANTLVKSRKRELDVAASVGLITPVERDRMIKRYADPKRMAIALSHGTVDDDGYDHTMDMFRSRKKAISLGEKTLAQQLGNGGDANPIIRDADKRAEAAKARR